MDFVYYLKNRHRLKPGSRPLSDVSAEQYGNRLHNLKRRGIYADEPEITEDMLQQIDRTYKNGLDHYPRALAYYIEYMRYLQESGGTGHDTGTDSGIPGK